MGIIPYYIPGGEIYKVVFLISSFKKSNFLQEAFEQSGSIFAEIAKNFLIPEDWDTYDAITETAVLEGI